MIKIHESHLEDVVIKLLELHGCKYLLPVNQEQEREGLDGIVLKKGRKTVSDLRRKKLF